MLYNEIKLQEQGGSVMERHGYIHDMLDVKVLLLFILSRAAYPIDLQKIYELSYQDDGVSYFDVAQAVPQMLESGHLEKTEDERYVITEKGREASAVTQDTIAYPVMQRAEVAVDGFNRAMRRSSFIKTKVQPREGGDYSVLLTLNDEAGDLMRLELMAPTQKQAVLLANSFAKSGEKLYQTVMDRLLADSEGT